MGSEIFSLNLNFKKLHKLKDLEIPILNLILHGLGHNVRQEFRLTEE